MDNNKQFQTSESRAKSKRKEEIIAKRIEIYEQLSYQEMKIQRDRLFAALQDTVIDQKSMLEGFKRVIEDTMNWEDALNDRHYYPELRSFVVSFELNKKLIYEILNYKLSDEDKCTNY